MAEDPTKNTDPDDVVDAEIAIDDAPVDGSDTDSPTDTDTAEADESADPTDAAGSAETKSVDGETEPATPRPVVRRKVVSKRVTPKGGGPARSSGPATRASIAAAQERARKKGQDDDLLVDVDEPAPIPRAAMNLPSPTWVPVLMFGLLIVGALVIILNYMGVFGDPSNVRLIFGLVFILGGIITATQYR